ncbi:flagellar protein FlgJ [alpha proteobacterium U9-1i]|nr:flagellar protein FlgJ [alpha proteobacterium U9-1i]
MAEFNGIPLRGAPLPMQQPVRTQPQVSPEIRRTAEQFESMFLSEMLAPMFENLDTEGLGGGGMGEQMFRPMLVEQYAAAIAHSGGIGLADSIITELNRMQAAQAAQAGVQQEPDDGADR